MSPKRIAIRTGNAEYYGILGPLVTEYRKRARISQGSLASRVGYGVQGSSSSGVDRLEKGMNDPQMSVVLSLCEVFGASFAEEVARLLFDSVRKGIVGERDAHIEEATKASKRLREVPDSPKMAEV